MRKTGLTLPFIHTHSSCLLSLALAPGVWQCVLAEGLLAPASPPPCTPAPSPPSLSLSLFSLFAMLTEPFPFVN